MNNVFINLSIFEKLDKIGEGGYGKKTTFGKNE